jgi:outer membrane protein assembly factor BamB
MSVANGMIFAGSFSGFMYAMDSSTGKILWGFDSSGSVSMGFRLRLGLCSGARVFAYQTGQGE